MSNNFVLGCTREFLEAQLGNIPLRLMGEQTREILDLASCGAMIVNTERLEHHVDHSLRLTAFSVIMKRYQDQRIAFMVLGRENGHFSIGLTQEVPLNQIVTTPLGGSNINISESLLRADATNRCKVVIKDEGKEIIIPTIYPVGFVRGGFELTKKYTRNIGVLFPHVIEFNSFMLHQEDGEDFNGINWMSLEQLEEFRKEHTFDPWSEELIKAIDKFVIFVNKTP
jgi:hypothetical protein